ncbi:tetratricopeptide repeat protein [Flavobacterium granuli]|uniref:Tetratricopeptide (TPR) repeat protein n=1 Tax=Flavobacterium granuli TaxID=280093 RepID=A0ABU1S1U5_9FLAO|nr:tetratricopeptide repeat protein [Flavobacterium granuli]MDR6844991.1 tetratricopeptide (TPR) repeat protein [Flavobacterium granuli]
MKIKWPFIFAFSVLLGNTVTVLAQTEPEEIKVEGDKFQDFFYESIFQKSIENYDKSLVALEQCLKLKPNEATIFFEMGKNYLYSKDYKNAYSSFEKATQIDPNNKWFWVGMYDVCYETKDFNQAIIIVNKIIPFDSEYKEDLVSIYMLTKQNEKALTLINELNEKVGKTERREMYKMEILSEGKYQNSEIDNLKEQIDKNPKEESNYIALIFLYSNNNEEGKAEDVAKKLEREIPESVWAHVSLFKSYLEKNEGANAVKSMNIVLGSSKIDSKIKHRVLNEFLIFANANPQFVPDLDHAIGYFKNDKSVNVAKEIGKFYYNKQQWEKAIKYYELSEKDISEVDLETNLLWLQANTELKQFEAVLKKSMTMIDTYPAEPQFYYYAGMANNQLQSFKKAKDILEMGLDYVVENKNLEINFNIQLGEAYNGLGDTSKKELYFNKANQLLKEKK